MELEESGFLEEAFKQAVAQLRAADDDMYRLPVEVQTFLRIYAPQGVIDNGGYRYFFEMDWPDNPPYSEFVEAYRRIGCVAQADELQRVVATFPFPEPHWHCDQRNEFMDAHWNEEKYCVEMWGDALCGDKDVFIRLEEYYLRHQDQFA